MRDRTVGDTFYVYFTTRAFATGIPTVLGGSAAISAYEQNSATQITAGISLGTSHDSVTGLNLITVVATGANGFETGKEYALVITTGTVDGVSVVGEVVGEFSLSFSAAAIDLANGTDGLGAIKADTAVILIDTADMQPKLGTPAGASMSADIADLPTVSEFNARTLASADYFDPAADTVANVTTVATVTDGATAAALATVDTNVDSILVDTAEIGTAGAGLTDLGGMSTAMKAEVNAECDTALTDYDGPTNAEMEARTLVAASYFDPAADAVANVTLVDTTTTNTDMVAAAPTAAANADAVWDEDATGHQTGGTFGQAIGDPGANAETMYDAVVTDAAGTNVAADVIAVKADTAATVIDTAEIGTAGAGLTDLGGMSTAMKAEVNAEVDTALTDYDGPTNAEMEARTPTAAQLLYMTDHAATALPVTFTGGTTTTAVLGNVDGSAASSTNDVYNGRVLIFNAGTLNEQATDITDYVGSTKTATITAVTTAVTSSHTAILV